MLPAVGGRALARTISFASRRREGYGPQDLQFFETLAGHVALAMERRRLNQELRRHTEGLERTVGERTLELTETVEELEHFSYALLHDLLAPLRAMIGFATLAEDGSANTGQAPEVLGHLKRVKVSSERMDHLVRDALNYTRVLRRDFPLRPVALLPLLQGLLESYPELCPHQNEIQLAPNLPVVVGNEAVLTECFSNLLRNAVKFVAPGARPQVRVWAETAPGPDAPPGFVHIWVEDNGIGIPEHAYQRVFTMFQRLHATDAYPGTGIGLAIVRKGIERIGGRVGVESQEGKGSRFWVELRAAATESRPQTIVA